MVTNGFCHISTLNMHVQLVDFYSTEITFNIWILKKCLVKCFNCIKKCSKCFGFWNASSLRSQPRLCPVYPGLSPSFSGLYTWPQRYRVKFNVSLYREDFPQAECSLLVVANCYLTVCTAVYFIYLVSIVMLFVFSVASVSGELKIVMALFRFRVFRRLRFIN